MKLVMNLNEDSELRAAVRELVDAQVKSVVRNEVAAIIQEETAKKLAGIDIPKLAQDTVARILNRDLDHMKGYSDLRSVAMDAAREYATNIAKTVDVEGIIFRAIAKDGLEITLNPKVKG